MDISTIVTDNLHVCEKRGKMNIVPTYNTIAKIWYADGEEQLIVLKKDVTNLIVSLRIADEYAEANPHLSLSFYHEINNPVETIF